MWLTVFEFPTNFDKNVYMYVHVVDRFWVSAHYGS
jgi:hypothetical protein